MKTLVPIRIRFPRRHANAAGEMLAKVRPSGKRLGFDVSEFASVLEIEGDKRCVAIASHGTVFELAKLPESPAMGVMRILPQFVFQ